LLGLFFNPEDGGDIFFPKQRLAFNGLHSVISQKTELFIITAVRASHPAFFTVKDGGKCEINDLEYRYPLHLAPGIGETTHHMPDSYTSENIYEYFPTVSKTDQMNIYNSVQ
jgi:hypothetical protein